MASEDFRQTATVGPSLPFDLSKDSLRRTALDARKAFVGTLDDGHRALLEQKLAEHLTSLCAHAAVVAGYHPLGSEISPMLAMEEARAVGRIAVGPPVNGIVEIGGPEQFRLDDLVRRRLAALKDPREVVADPKATYSGAKIGERTLVPGDDARLGETTFETWLTQSARRAA